MRCRRRLDAGAEQRHRGGVSAHQHLRTATAASHEEVDAAFGGFDLGDRKSYGRFLTAHAHVLPAIEAALADDVALPGIDPRAPLLAEDLAALALPLPAWSDVMAPATSAGRFGMLYVIEGSRLGGGMLARAVGPGLPRAYLSAVHERGGWRAFGQAVDAAAAEGGADWLDEAVDGARRTFELYAMAARQEALPR